MHIKEPPIPQEIIHSPTTGRSGITKKQTMASYKIVCMAACLAAVVMTSTAAPGHAQSYAVSNLHSHGGYGGGFGGGFGGGSGGGHHEEHYHHHPKYHFKYGVEDHHTGDHKDQKEERDGDVVHGEYSLLQPDGRKRVVHYTASKHGGFNAHVSYSGHAIHPYHHKHHY